MKLKKEDILVIVFIVLAIIIAVMVCKPYMKVGGVYSTIGINKAQEVMNELN